MKRNFFNNLLSNRSSELIFAHNFTDRFLCEHLEFRIEEGFFKSIRNHVFKIEIFRLDADLDIYKKR